MTRGQERPASGPARPGGRAVKREYALALLCYLSIPALAVIGAAVVRLLEWPVVPVPAAYVVHAVLEAARLGTHAVVAALVLVLWVVCCALVLRSRGRSPRWLALALAGPFGFGVLATLADRSPRPGDRYQRFVRSLRVAWRVPFELAVFVSVWCVAYELVVLTRELLIGVEAITTGTPRATIVARQDASGGMWAFVEALEVLYLVPLVYLVWPLVVNGVAHLVQRRSAATAV